MGAEADGTAAGQEVRGTSARPCRRRLYLLGAALAIAGAIVGIYHRYDLADLFKHSLSELTVAQGRLRARTGALFSGTLQARDEEIWALGRHVFAGSPLAAEIAAKPAPRGLLVEARVEEGRLQGPARLLLDLRRERASERLAPLAGTLRLRVARAISPRQELSAATFVDGRLQGVVQVWAPSDSSRARAKLFEATFRDGVPQGRATLFSDQTGRPRWDVELRDGVPHGARRRYYPDGRLDTLERYQRGVLVGAEGFYQSGKLRDRSRYAGGVITGEERFFPDGRVRAKITYSGGAPSARQEWHSNGEPVFDPLTSRQLPRNGLIRTYHRSGALHTEGRYEGDQLHGRWRRYYGSGTLWEDCRYRNGLQDGPQKRWWKNGKLALDAGWKDGQLEGAYRRFYDDGKRWEVAAYRAGRLVGPYRKWWRNGRLAHEYRYDQRGIHGGYRTYYDSGAKWAVGQYEHGRPVGRLRRWFPDGRLGFEQHFEAGLPHGAHRRWYANGRPRLVATYVRGVLDGEYRNWLEDGSVYKLAVYSHGKLTSSSARPAAERGEARERPRGAN